MNDREKNGFSEQGIFRGKAGNIILILVTALIAGGGGGLIHNKFNDPRPDPYTGTQGHVLEARIKVLEETRKKEMEKLDNMLTALHRIEVQIALLPPRDWRLRIRELERRIGHEHQMQQD